MEDFFWQTEEVDPADGGCHHWEGKGRRRGQADQGGHAREGPLAYLSLHGGAMCRHQPPLPGPVSHQKTTRIHIFLKVISKKLCKH